LLLKDICQTGRALQTSKIPDKVWIWEPKQIEVQIEAVESRKGKEGDRERGTKGLPG